MSSFRSSVLRRAVAAAVLAAASSLPAGLESQTPASAAAASAPVPQDRVNGWRSDIAFWLDQIRKQHYVYKSKPLPPALLKAAAQLSDNVPKFSDERMLFEMQRLAAYTLRLPHSRPSHSRTQGPAAHFLISFIITKTLP